VLFVCFSICLAGPTLSLVLYKKYCSLGTKHKNSLFTDKIRSSSFIYKTAFLWKHSSIESFSTFEFSTLEQNNHKTTYWHCDRFSRTLKQLKQNVKKVTYKLSVLRVGRIWLLREPQSFSHPRFLKKYALTKFLGASKCLRCRSKTWISTPP